MVFRCRKWGRFATDAYIESDIRRVEAEQKVDLGHQSKRKAEQEEQFYPQFSEKLREEADAMAARFAIFYCLENSIRELISRALDYPQHGVA